MNRYLLATIAGLVLALLPLVARAADSDRRGFILRVDGDVTLARGESVGSLVVVNGDAQVDGDVHDAVVVLRGTATITGTVGQNVTVVDGTLNLRSGASVKDVNLVHSTLNRDDGASVTGAVHQRSNVVFRGAWLVFTVVLWAGMTIAAIVTGLVFAASGGRQLRTSARSLTEDTVSTIVAAFALWIGAAVVGVVLFVTVVGIPLGIGLLLFVLPALWFLGYVVAGTRLGGALVGLGRGSGEHPYAAAALGILLLQLIVLIPAIGWFTGAFAGFWGSGALALMAFHAASGRPGEAAGGEAPAATDVPATGP
ncbi:MAG TPA: polymer-forming cytoskeletal protein [Dehalococcoidia bacterium]|jgi:hypothetical protein